VKDNSHALTYKYLIAACLASLIISTFASYFFYDKWSEAEDRYMAVVTDKNAIAQKYAQEKNAFDKIFGDLSILRDENAKVFTLQATDSTKRYLARVYWNRYTHETYIDIISLPAPSDSTKQYQLWALQGGQPVDAGIFRIDADENIQRAKAVMNADTWCVSLEPKGGSTAPTPDQVLLVSKY